jgi:hypothetical protein
MKVKVFMWLAVRKSILTKDMLQPRGWRGDEKCQFCGGNETIIHLFFSCPLARYIWNLASCVNSFKNKPVSVQHLLGGWMRDSRKSEFFLVTVGVAAILWVFGKQGIMLVSDLIRQLVSSWAILQVKEENRHALIWRG